MQEIRPTACAFGPYAIRADEQVLRFRGDPIPLAPKIVATLRPFFEEPGRVISKVELMDRVWPETFVEEANLTQNIYLLRKLFEEHRSSLRIENVPKRGYRLVGPATHAPPAAASDVRAPLRPRPIPRLAVAVLILCCTVTVAAFSVHRLVKFERPAMSPYQLDAVALRQYLLGKYYLNRGTYSDVRRSAAYFGDLAKRVPASALGYAGLAEDDTSRTFFSGDRVERANLSARAIGYAREAVCIEPNSTEAYAALGAVESSLEHDEPGSERAFRTALRLDPGNFDALAWYGTALMNGGHPAEARALLERAMSLDPSVPGIVASVAWADFLLRDYRDAAAFSRQLIRAHELESVARITLASADVKLSDYGDALREIRALEQRAPAAVEAVALHSQIDAMRGHRSVALAALERLEATANFERIGSWDILAMAAAYAQLGRDDDAFVWLDRVQASERPQLARDPRFDALRSDRRFRSWLSG